MPNPLPLLLACVLAFLPALAQSQPLDQPPPPPRHGQQPPPDSGHRPPHPPCMIPTDQLATLDLTPAQRQSIDALIGDYKPQCDKAANQVRILSDKLHSDLAIILTPEQLATLRPPRPPHGPDSHQGNMPPGDPGLRQPPPQM